jgi:oligopeptidase B
LVDEFTLHVKIFFTGEILKDTIENATGNSTWANDNQTIFYTRQDEKTLRSDKFLDIKYRNSKENDELFILKKTILLMWVLGKKNQENTF